MAAPSCPLPLKFKKVVKAGQIFLVVQIVLYQKGKVIVKE